jgi:hypothetical protein
MPLFFVPILCDGKQNFASDKKRERSFDEKTNIYLSTEKRKLQLI